MSGQDGYDVDEHRQGALDRVNHAINSVSHIDAALIDHEQLRELQESLDHLYELRRLLRLDESCCSNEEDPEMYAVGDDVPLGGDD